MIFLKLTKVKIKLSLTCKMKITYIKDVLVKNKLNLIFYFVFRYRLNRYKAWRLDNPK